MLHKTGFISGIEYISRRCFLFTSRSVQCCNF